jgi:hypothetical protein
MIDDRTPKGVDSMICTVLDPSRLGANLSHSAVAQRQRKSSPGPIERRLDHASHAPMSPEEGASIDPERYLR